MKQIIFDLKTLTNVKAGIGRYCINLTSHLLKRKKNQYFGKLKMGGGSQKVIKWTTFLF